MKIQVDTTLTSYTAGSRGLEWWFDSTYDDEGLDESERQLLGSDLSTYSFGLPRDPESSMAQYSDKKNLVGVYRPIERIYKNQHKVTIDKDLTPENASENGQRWHADGIYDPDVFVLDEEEELRINGDYIELDKQGYKLGQPAGKNGSRYAVGIYEPIK
jgi:hypothetical protein